ncbi:TolC family protein [Daejeonella sp. H1SJ63]|jgi:outer membrane protein TolC|uniref:TolC family protein n=1 Tax=Daejeonella sp. H1SJ63 TaxID=3034145 RepID=UPI0023EB36A6|nr:TolC family protein [Daejeonella sp. H1SJ63]
MFRKYFLLTALSIVLQISYTRAQESMMTEISYVFLEKLIATAKENYPRMNSFESRIKSAKTTVGQEQLSWLDAFSFSYIYNPNNTLNVIVPQFFNGYQVAFNVNLSSFLQKPGNVKQAKESVKIARYDLEEYHLTLETEVKRRYFAYIQAMSNLRLQSKISSDALNISREIKTKYEKSEATFEQYSMSQMSYSGALQSKITAESNFLIAKASLEELLTKKIEEVQ